MEARDWEKNISLVKQSNSILGCINRAATNDLELGNGLKYSSVHFPKVLIIYFGANAKKNTTFMFECFIIYN